jgi:hypothetical protein
MPKLVLASMQVHIYNVPGLMPWATSKGGLASAQAMFPPGQQLAFIEPTYKLLPDGTYGIREEIPHKVRTGVTFDSEVIESRSQ